MIDTTTIAQLAQQLHAAEKSRHVIRLFSPQFPDMTIADAYAIQSAWVDIKLKEGRKADWPQDRPRLARHADAEQYQRTGLRGAAR